LLATPAVVNNGSYTPVHSSIMSAAINPSTPEKNTPSAPRWRKELLLALACLAVGAIVLPILIYVVGVPLLGAYGGGAGIGAFYGDFLRNLMAGMLRTWFIVLAPYLMLALLRLIFWPWGRKLPVNQGGVPSEPARSKPAPSAPRERREPFVAP
jgi:hypothetical protein